MLRRTETRLRLSCKAHYRIPGNSPLQTRRECNNLRLQSHLENHNKW
jgi:hypothetical protein